MSTCVEPRMRQVDTFAVESFPTFRPTHSDRKARKFWVRKYAARGSGLRTQGWIPRNRSGEVQLKTKKRCRSAVPPFFFDVRLSASRRFSPLLAASRRFSPPVARRRWRGARTSSAQLISDIHDISKCRKSQISYFHRLFLKAHAHSKISEDAISTACFTSFLLMI